MAGKVHGSGSMVIIDEDMWRGGVWGGDVLCQKSKICGEDFVTARQQKKKQVPRSSG